MFSNDDIIRMAGGVTYERGRQLYDAGYVLDMDVQTAGDYDEIVASVRGSGAKVYETDLLILRETGELEECYCECPAFRSYDGICFSAALERGNFMGTQFHPEKSGSVGEKVLASFLEAI